MNEISPLQINVIQHGRPLVYIDSSVLVKLAAMLPPEFVLEKTHAIEEPVRLWSSLDEIARRGCINLIPEMVSYETAGVLRDGESVDQYFPLSAKKRNHVIAALLKKSKKAKTLFIQPPPRDDETVAGVFIRKVYKKHSDPSINSVQKGARIAEQHRRFDIADGGKVAALELIRALKEKRGAIFYLSDNKKALDSAVTVRPDLGVRMLTLHDFLGGLIDNNLLTPLGIQIANPAEYYTTLEARGGYDGVDGQCLWNPRYTNVENRIAFAQALAALGHPDHALSAIDAPRSMALDKRSVGFVKPPESRL